MTDIRSLVPASDPGWRVAVATAYYPDGAARVAIHPLVGWAQVDDREVGVYWAPAWWEEFGLCTGFQHQSVWPLGPGEVLELDHAEYLKAEATESYVISQRQASAKLRQD